MYQKLIKIKGSLSTIILQVIYTKYCNKNHYLNYHRSILLTYTYLIIYIEQIYCYYNDDYKYNLHYTFISARYLKF